MIEMDGSTKAPVQTISREYDERRIDITRRNSSSLTNRDVEAASSLKQQRVERRKARSEKKIMQRQARSDLVSSNDRSSLLFYFLVFGLMICLSDVFYVIVFVDNFLGLHAPNSTPEQESPDMSAVTDADGAAIRDAGGDPRKGKERIMEILKEAGIEDVDDETIRKLPTWAKVTSLYGDHPRIYGLDQCEVFRKRSDEGEHFLSVAGAFNSGTNLMSELLIHNCHMPARMKKYGAKNRGIRWQVPWGKHNPPSDEKFRQSHKTMKDSDVDANNVLPAVTIRDPYSWMGSMCRHKYEAQWRHTEKHCPNLVPNFADKASFPGLIGSESVPVFVRYNGFSNRHDSLAHMWNDWYANYVNADFPRIIVRFEDLVFFAKEMTETVCKCAGGEMNRGGFRYIVDSAKKGPNAHGAISERTSMVDAIMRYGTDRKRFSGFTKEDLLFANATLNRELVEFFGYSDPPERLVG